MTALSISRAWDETKAVLAKEGRLVAAVALALLVLPQTTLGAFAPTHPDQISSLFYFMLVVALVAGLVGQVAIARLSIPPSSTVGEAIAIGARRLPPLFLAFLLVFLVVMIVAVVLVFAGMAIGLSSVPDPDRPPPLSLLLAVLVPFLLTYAIFQLLVPVAASEGGGPLSLIGRSWMLGRPNYLKLLGFVVLVVVVMLLVWGVAQLAVGSIVALIFGPPAPGTAASLLASLIVAIAQASWSVITVVMLTRLYVQLSGRDTVEAPAAS